MELPVTNYYGKILPNQNFNNFLFQGDGDFMVKLFDLLTEHSLTITNDTFKLKGHPNVDFEAMSTPPTQLALLKFLIDMSGTKTFLEIGTFIGNTSMHIANFIGPSAEVVTIEKFSEFASLASENFKNNPFTGNIKLIEGDALSEMKLMDKQYFDFIYVDGDKENYLELTQIAETKVSPGGIILVDDVFFHGDALNQSPSTSKGNGCKRLLEHYKDTKRFSKYILPINNGILFLKDKS
jgi:caffeoyl-CoA O-methyltransferase